MPAATTDERCAGITTPTQVWRVSKPRTVPCSRPVAFVVEDGARRTLSCTQHLGGITARAAAQPRYQGWVSVWTLARWRAELEA